MTDLEDAGGGSSGGSGCDAGSSQATNVSPGGSVDTWNVGLTRSDRCCS